MYLIAGVAVVGAMMAAISINFYHFARDLKKYCGVHSYDDRNEVLYLLGFPPAVLDDSQKDSLYPGRRSYKTNRAAAAEDPDKVIPQGRTVADYYEWSYPLRETPNGGASVFVDFDRATKFIDHIDCVDFTDTQHACAPLAGINIGDSEDRVKDRLGKPDRLRLEGAMKIMAYDGVGVEFRLTKGSVYYLRLDGKKNRSMIQLLDFYLRDLIF
jgi:hypothetical protein